jgi:hypothetical protein
MNDLNQMQFCRRWARINETVSDGDLPVVLSPKAARLLGEGLLVTLGAADAVWELKHQRKLTEEEKFGPPKDEIRCPDCGQPVPSFYDHIDILCYDVGTVVKPDSVRDEIYRLKSVAATLERSGANAIPIGFAQLAHDIQKILALFPDVSK